jgi:GMP synthase (glutamine-hydrolysing)
MKKLYVVKTGTTYAPTARRFGDFDSWTLRGLGDLSMETQILDAEQEAPLPDPGDCAGVVITGSHAMVTDNLPWSVKLEQWIPLLLGWRTPVLGICYGHQLLARAASGKVGFHPLGMEMGTVAIQLLPEAASDKLFQNIPSLFLAHVCHSQTVLSLPPGAIGLARSDHESNHAFRIGECAWGVQFHPEYTADIMRSYIEEESEALIGSKLDAARLLHEVREARFAAETLSNFAQILECEASGSEKGNKH